MKVLLVNGSPHRTGCTYTALSEVAKALNEAGVDTTHFHIGRRAISGCIACDCCVETGDCALGGTVREFTDLAAEYDGFVIGSPVYYSGMNGSLKSFLDRAFYSAARENSPFRLKPAAAVVSARRAGTTSTFDEINKYFFISQMIVVPSCYWNMVHGRTPEEVRQDEEGMQIMRTLGRNMAYLLRLKEAGTKAGVALPEQEKRVYTNFIR